MGAGIGEGVEKGNSAQETWVVACAAQDAGLEEPRIGDLWPNVRAQVLKALHPYLYGEGSWPTRVRR